MSLLAGILSRRAQVLHACQPNQTVAETVALMSRAGVGIVPVLDGHRLVGVFSERDLLRRVVAKKAPIDATCLRDVMTPDPVTATARDTREDAIRKMRARGCRHLPILEGDRVVDMLSMRDLLHEEIRDREDEIRTLQDYIQGSG